MKQESKEVAVKAQNAVAVAGSAEDMNAWAAPELTAQDVVIPRLLIMQPTSKILLEGQGLQLGDVVDSLTKQKLSSKDEALEFVPFFQTKVWVEYDVTDGDDIKNKKFLRITPVTPANENLPYKDEEKTAEGKMLKVMRDRCANFYILLKKDLDLGTALPYVLTTRRSSFKAGKTLTTQMYMKNRAANKGPAHVMMAMQIKREQDENVYFVPEISPKAATPPEYVKVAFEWLQKIKAGAKLDESSFSEEAAQPMHGGSADIEKGPAQF